LLKCLGWGEKGKLITEIKAIKKDKTGSGGNNKNICVNL
jgi:hypothetical protein